MDIPQHTHIPNQAVKHAHTEHLCSWIMLLDLVGCIPPVSIVVVEERAEAVPRSTGMLLASKKSREGMEGRGISQNSLRLLCNKWILCLFCALETLQHSCHLVAIQKLFPASGK